MQPHIYYIDHSADHEHDHEHDDHDTSPISGKIGPNDASALIHGFEWGDGGGVGINVTYSFPDATPSYYADFYLETNGFVSFTSAMKVATRNAFEMIETFTNLTFTETSGETGGITLGQAEIDPEAVAWAYYPDQGSIGGDIWMNTDFSFINEDTTVGGTGNYVLLHEIGHALGLEHSFEVGLTGVEDSEQYTLMSYDRDPWGSLSPETYMLYDIAALQEIYGANMDYNSGRNVYKVKADAAYTIWDGGGRDMLDGSDLSTNLDLDLTAGAFSSAGNGLTDHITIAYGATIENARGGTGNDTITGNDVSNRLFGGAGDDSLFGYAGADVLVGDSGNDTLEGGDGNDRLYGKEDNDTLRGGDGADLLLGEDGNDTLYGDAGADRLYGGSNDDIIYGGDDNDRLYGQNGNDTFYGGDGADRMYSNAGDNNTGYGGNGNDIGIGAGGVDEFYGGNDNDRFYLRAGDDVANGEDGVDLLLGEDGNDTLLGGAGNDRLYGGNDDDILIGGSGFDKLYAGSGSDMFGVSADEDSADHFYNFDLLDDTLNITDILTGFDSDTDDIADFVQLVHTADRFDLEVDSDGGGNSFSSVAKIYTNIDNAITAQDLLDSGNLVVDFSLI